MALAVNRSFIKNARAVGLREVRRGCRQRQGARVRQDGEYLLASSRESPHTKSGGLLEVDQKAALDVSFGTLEPLLAVLHQRLVALVEANLENGSREKPLANDERCISLFDHSSIFLDRETIVVRREILIGTDSQAHPATLLLGEESSNRHACLDMHEECAEGAVHSRRHG
jgi:hypothetical protein